MSAVEAFLNGQNTGAIAFATNPTGGSGYGGGDGKSTFALPDLRGSAPMHPGQGPGLSPHDLGEADGSDTVTLKQTEMPSHNHTMNANGFSGELQQPAPNRSLARPSNDNAYQTSNQGLGTLAPQALSPAGGDAPHNNMQPYLTFNFCIALQGVFPPRS